VLLIHGGGFTRSPTGPQQVDAAKSIAAAGYWVFEITYRLAPPGQIPGQKSKGQFPDQTNDVHLAVHAARVDPRGNGQVGGIGGSAGAYHVAFAALTGKAGDDRLDVGVCLSGAYDLSDADSQKLNAQFKAKVINYAGSDRRDKLLAASPVSYVTADAPPLFLVQSTREAMPYQQLPDLVAKMLSIPVKSVQQQIILPGRAHSWANWPKVKDQAIAFLKAGFAQKSKPDEDEGLDAKLDLK
jgi:acetyl esterase/lipase